MQSLVVSRGWLREDDAVDLAFTVDADQRQRENSEALLGTLDRDNNIMTNDQGRVGVVAIEPDHFVLTVDEETSDVKSMSEDAIAELEESHLSQDPRNTVGQLSSTLLETLALIHTTSPPPPGSYALAFPPEGCSLDKIASELSSFGIPAYHLTPELFSSDLGAIAGQADNTAPPILLAKRSAVYGLHLADLHTVYLPGGLDLASLPASQNLQITKASHRAREIFYEVVAGRVGRLGTKLGTQAGPQDRQRIITLVLTGSEEEEGMRCIMFPRNSPKKEMRESEEEQEAEGADREVRVERGKRRYRLREWDVEGMGRMVGRYMKDEDDDEVEWEEFEEYPDEGDETGSIREVGEGVQVNQGAERMRGTG